MAEKHEALSLPQARELLRSDPTKKRIGLGGANEGIMMRLTTSGQDRFDVVYRDANGRKCIQVFRKITPAQRRRDELRVAADTGNLPDVAAGKKKLSEVWDYFAENRVTRTGEPIKASTFASYEVRWKKQIAPVLGGVTLADLTRPKIEEFYNAVQSEADAKKRNGRDARRKCQQLVHRLLFLAVRQGWLSRNPADDIPMPRAPKFESHPLTEVQVDAIAANVPARYCALVILLAESGVRIGEAVALRVRNVNGSIAVREAAAEVNGERVLGSPKTYKSVRDVPITPKLRAALKEHFDSGYANRFKKDALIFSTEGGFPVGQANFRNRVFQPAARAAKVRPTPRVHDLRHYWATTWLSRQTPSGERLSVFDIAKLGGWTDLKMVMQRYGHVQVESAQSLVDRIFAVTL